MDDPTPSLEREPACPECGVCFPSVVHACCMNIDEVRRIADDPRYSDEFVGATVRMALKTQATH